jgi:hypothetical protein
MSLAFAAESLVSCDFVENVYSVVHAANTPRASAYSAGMLSFAVLINDLGELEAGKNHDDECAHRNTDLNQINYHVRSPTVLNSLLYLINVTTSRFWMYEC